MKSTRRRLRRICTIRLECTAVSPRLWLLKRTSRLKRPRKMRTTYSRKLRCWNRIIAGDNAHSYACLRLFLHASTKVSCVVFLMRCPFREISTSRCSSQWHSTSYAIGKVFLLHFLCYTVQRTFCHCERSVAISRKGYLVKEWWLPNDCNDIKCVARNCIKCVRKFCFCRVLRRKLSFFTTVANYFAFVCGF